MFKLSKRDRLVDPKHIKMLFKEGRSFKIPPLKVFCVKKSREIISNDKVLFSVPKKRICSAVKRNKVKRLLREAYRINRRILAPSYVGNEENKFVILIGYIYHEDEKEIQQSMLNDAVIASLKHLKALLYCKEPL
ncbi:ribonuclease P protein component [Cardinium endosymbiont of Culicoides punctatus]|uniref:ribonuclease P protein component n=1 Tax=Cardinium endosymbiont of Culicoides punctatus TaxID=2304601 RepID=UPI0021013CE8|nr:ribonuclease P protein component [Cardinium endosymbiont of Culicoides punctatus]